MKNSSELLYLENQLCFPLYAASRLTTKMYEPLLKKLDLTYPQYLVLLVLWRKDKLSVNEIGQQLFLESNTLTPLLQRLEEKKIIERKRSVNDERKVMVTLTKKGTNLKSNAAKIPEKILQKFSGENIHEKEVKIFTETLNKLISVLNENHHVGSTV